MPLDPRGELGIDRIGESRNLAVTFQKDDISLDDLRVVLERCVEHLGEELLAALDLILGELDVFVLHSLEEWLEILRDRLLGMLDRVQQPSALLDVGSNLQQLDGPPSQHVEGLEMRLGGPNCLPLPGAAGQDEQAEKEPQSHAAHADYSSRRASPAQLKLAPMALIEFRGVKKAFGPKQVYRDLNLEIQEGEVLTIIGGSGQGKSVMLKMLIGLLDIDDGEIFFDGALISGISEAEYAPVRRRVAMLFQAGALFDSLTTKENVAYGLREQLSLTELEISERVRESLTYVGLPGTEETWPADMSAGMKKRVSLARALAIRPEVLLYDEPTTGLDPINVTRIADLIEYLNGTLDVTSVVVTHDMDTALAISDRIAMIQDGYVIFSGTPDELRASTDPRVVDFIEGNAPVDEDTETLLRSAG